MFRSRLATWSAVLSEPRRSHASRGIRKKIWNRAALSFASSLIRLNWSPKNLRSRLSIVVKGSFRNCFKKRGRDVKIIPCGYFPPSFLSAQISPMSPRSPTIVTAAAVRAPEIAAAKVNVAITRHTISANTTSTIGFASTFLANVRPPFEHKQMLNS